MENKKPSGMNGVINSAINPLIDFNLDTERERLGNALLDTDYLIALCQKSFFNDQNYDENDPKWENVTPKQYREGMGAALAYLEDKLYEAFIKSENILRDCAGLPPVKEE